MTALLATIATASVLYIGISGRRRVQSATAAAITFLDDAMNEHQHHADVSVHGLTQVAELLRTAGATGALVISPTCRGCRHILDEMPNDASVLVLSCGPADTPTQLTEITKAGCAAISGHVSLPAVVSLEPGTLHMVEVDSWHAAERSLHELAQGAGSAQ